MKTNPRIQGIEQKIQHLKAQLQRLGAIRPGSLSPQYNVCGKPGCRCKDHPHPRRHGPYYKLSYVHRGRFSSQFVRQGEVAAVRAELANYKQFRRLTREWVDWSLKLAKARRVKRP